MIIAIGLVLAGCDHSSAPSLPAPDSGPDSCQIDRVIDGDTVHVRCPSGVEGNLRLLGFDTPETYRPRCFAEKALGTRAKLQLQTSISKASRIQVYPQGRDKYDRLLAQLLLDGVDVAETMIRKGLAVRYSGGKRIDWCERLKA